jgi:CheY-like chemotaxis protein
VNDARPRAATPNDPRHVLVVDDEARIREVVQYALERQGFRVRGVQDLREARSALAQRSYELVVLDVMLPDGDGLELCKEIRRAHKTPVLFLSARGDEIDRILGPCCGGPTATTRTTQTGGCGSSMARSRSISSVTKCGFAATMGQESWSRSRRPSSASWPLSSIDRASCSRDTS